MAALRHRYACRSFIHLRRSIFSTTTLAKANKPTLIEESVEVKTVDQTVSGCMYSSLRDCYHHGNPDSLESKTCVVFHKNRRKDMYVYSYQPGMQCNLAPITLINGRLNLRMKNDGKTL